MPPPGSELNVAAVVKFGPLLGFGSEVAANMYEVWAFTWDCQTWPKSFSKASTWVKLYGVTPHRFLFLRGGETREVSVVRRRYGPRNSFCVGVADELQVISRFLRSQELAVGVVAELQTPRFPSCLAHPS